MTRDERKYSAQTTIRLIIGALLSGMGFDKNLPPTADQSAGAQQAMLIGFVWVPVGTQLLAMLLLYWYRLEKRDLVTAEAPPGAVNS